MSSSQLQTAYDMLFEQILSGELAPGTRLVNRTISKQIGVSTIPVREAIHRLTSEGLVQHIPNAGAYVRELTRDELIQLYDYRNELEKFTIERAIKHIDSYQLSRIEGICAQWQEIISQTEAQSQEKLSEEHNQEWVKLDLDFHKILSDAAHNTWLTRSIQQLRLMSRIVYTKPPHIFINEAKTTLNSHQAIVDAIKAQDESAAIQAMEVHNNNAFITAMEYYEANH